MFSPSGSHSSHPILSLSLGNNASTECLGRDLRNAFLPVLSKVIYSGCVLRGIWDGDVAQLSSGCILHGGQVIDGPPHWYPFRPIGGWIIGKDAPLKQQTSHHKDEFPIRVSDVELQGGKSTPPRSMVQPRMYPR